MSLQITVTEAASLYIKKMLMQKHGIGFRLSIKKTGCSGYAYSPSIVDTINPLDMTFEAEGELKICVDAKWSALLNGLKIDYIEEEKSGLKQKRLVFTNPNESTRCGCGESFHIE